MNEQIQTFIDRARALLASAGSKWDDVAVAGTPSGYWAVANARATYETANADAALIAAAPGLLAALLDALEAADRRAEEAEAQCETSRAEFAALGDHFSRNVLILNDVATQVCCTHFERLPEAVRELVAGLHAAEARVADVEAAQKMRAESADPDDETWHTREEYLRRVKAEARIADLESVRIEQAAKLRRHLDEIAELQDRAGIAEGREAAAKANAEQMAGWLDARNAGLVQMARERDALREKLAAAEAKAARMKAPTAKVCRCVNTTYSFDPARAVVLPLAGYSITAGVGCPSCGGSGAVIVETASGE